MLRRLVQTETHTEDARVYQIIVTNVQAMVYTFKNYEAMKQGLLLIF